MTVKPLPTSQRHGILWRFYVHLPKREYSTCELCGFWRLSVGQQILHRSRHGTNILNITCLFSANTRKCAIHPELAVVCFKTDLHFFSLTLIVCQIYRSSGLNQARDSHFPSQWATRAAGPGRRSCQGVVACTLRLQLACVATL